MYNILCFIFKSAILTFKNHKITSTFSSRYPNATISIAFCTRRAASPSIHTISRLACASTCLSKTKASVALSFYIKIRALKTRTRDPSTYSLSLLNSLSTLPFRTCKHLTNYCCAISYLNCFFPCEQILTLAKDIIPEALEGPGERFRTSYSIFVA